MKTAWQQELKPIYSKFNTDLPLQ
ncbi:hypothetical protein PM8797T_21493 [Gimesia maris DSM 8797]|nr:hypothetical protein PM8797T_21493 [Gimesia maris DSM 8797]